MPFFQDATKGQAGFQYTYDREIGLVSYYASFPVRAEGGAIVGVAVLKKSLERIAAEMRHFERTFFVVDGDGIVVMTNRPEMMNRPLWPRDRAGGAMSAPDKLDQRALLKKEIFNPDWLLVDGARDYVQRRPFVHSDWSLVTLRSPRGIFASRVFGIVFTLQITVIVILYLVGRERWMHDSVQLEKRVQLEELTRHLDFRATTDPLTGLYNRRKFNRELAAEMLRAKRHNTPLSLVMFDIDHFKRINDTYGHPAGDSVLVQLAHVVSAQMRGHDVLARWGGEEFVILAPGSDGLAALQFAERLRDQMSTVDFEQVGKVSCSFGVAELADREAPESLIARADAALYRAKLAGRDCVEFSPLPSQSFKLATAV